MTVLFFLVKCQRTNNDGDDCNRVLAKDMFEHRKMKLYAVFQFVVASGELGKGLDSACRLFGCHCVDSTRSGNVLKLSRPSLVGELVYDCTINFYIAKWGFVVSSTHK